MILFYQPLKSIGSEQISIDVAEELEVKALDDESFDLFSDDFLDVKASWIQELVGVGLKIWKNSK